MTMNKVHAYGRINGPNFKITRRWHELLVYQEITNPVTQLPMNDPYENKYENAWASPLYAQIMKKSIIAFKIFLHLTG